MPGVGAGIGVSTPPTLPPRWKLTKPAYSAQFIYPAVSHYNTPKSNAMEKIMYEILEIIEDYRAETKDGVSINDIELWISQFDKEEREFILEETRNILDNTYCPKNVAFDLFKDLIEFSANNFKYKDVASFLDETEFLSLQNYGKSQTIMIEMFEDLFMTNYNYDLQNRKKKTIKNYIYIDDVLCTGSTLYHDISQWLNKKINGQPRHQLIVEKEQNIIFAYMIIHKENYQKKINQIQHNFGEGIIPRITMIRGVVIDNSSNKPLSKCEIVKPINENLSDYTIEYKKQIIDLVDNYVAGKYPTKDDFFRKPYIPIIEGLYSSKENRKRIERIFLEKGIDILNKTVNQTNKQIRPLGYSLPSHKNFGFGALCFNWRNVPNTTPLVFWYNGGGFIPLFKRYQQTNDPNARIAHILNKIKRK